jgi:hypothetical protein
MAKPKPWFQVVFPREDLRQNRPLDASEFAVHLDQVRDGRAPVDYREPERFFDRTYLTRNLIDLSSQVVRRLNGIKVETSAVFNMATQFGGGKTHALTLLYHLAKGGPAAAGWNGVRKILDAAGVTTVPQAAAAVFVGTEFDSIAGRGGNGEPLRRTPWGELAWQLGGERAYQAVARHDEQGTAPGGDVIRQFLPEGPCVVLLDELMNYIHRNRSSGLSAQFYHFLQALSEEARGRDRMVLAVSVPASELEMTAEDTRDFQALKKLLDRVGRAILMSTETETAEIIRRRLFEWKGVPDEARATVKTWSDWIGRNRAWLGEPDPAATTRAFEACYPFHPSVLSVFERKWQSLPRFQKTRGVLRLLALWVSHAYEAGYRGAHEDTLLGLGTAPIENAHFRTAMFEELGNNELEGPVTTDIAGRDDANALRLDREATEPIRKIRLHQKVATTIFFESNGGQERTEATQPEIRFAVADPFMDIANVDTVLEDFGRSAYHLLTVGNRYRFTVKPNLTKIQVDRRMGIQDKEVEKRLRAEILRAFPKTAQGAAALDVIPFPEGSHEVPDAPRLTFVVLAPDQARGDATRAFVDELLKNSGRTGRTHKTGLIVAVPDGLDAARKSAKDVLAWEDVEGDRELVNRLDGDQQRQLAKSKGEAGRDLKEAVWRAYRYVWLLGKDNQVREFHLPNAHASAASSLTEFILNRLVAGEEVSGAVSVRKLVGAWPAERAEWPTLEARNTFYASPFLPRLLDPACLKRTIAEGVREGRLGYAERPGADGRYAGLRFATEVGESEIELSDDVVLLTADKARSLIEPPRLVRLELRPGSARLKPGEEVTFSVAGYDQNGAAFACGPASWQAGGGTLGVDGRYTAGSTEAAFVVQATVGTVEATATVTIAKAAPTPVVSPGRGLRWSGEVPPAKWMNLYLRVLSRFATGGHLRIRVQFELPPEAEVSDAVSEETRAALRELGLNERLDH